MEALPKTSTFDSRTRLWCFTLTIFFAAGYVGFHPIVARVAGGAHLSEHLLLYRTIRFHLFLLPAVVAASLALTALVGSERMEALANQLVLSPKFRGAAALVATAIIGLVVLQDFPMSEDEYSTVYQAQLFAEGRLAADVTDEAFALKQLVLDGKLYSKYEPGWPLLLAPGIAAGIPWLINPLLAAVALLTICSIGRRLFGKRAGAGAAALCLVSPFFLLNSAGYNSHPASLATSLLFVLFYIRTVEDGGIANALAAGAALGTGLLVRPFDAFVVSLPFAIYSLWLMIRRRGGMRVGQASSLTTGKMPVPQPGLIVQMLSMGAVVMVFAAALLAYQWVQTGDAMLSPRTVYQDPALIGLAAPPVDNPDIDFDLAAIWRLNVLGFTPVWLARLGFWLVPFTTIFALFALFVKKSRWERLLWCSIASVIVGYFFHLGSGGDGYGPRYYYAALGFISLFAARGRQALWLWSSGHARYGRWRGAVGAIVIFGLALGVLVNVPSKMHAAAAVVAGRSSIYRAVREAGIRNAVVFIDSDMPEHNAWFTRNTPSMDADVLYARYFGPGRAAKLMCGLGPRGQFPTRKAYRCTFKIGPGVPLPESIRLAPLDLPALTAEINPPGARQPRARTNAEF